MGIKSLLASVVVLAGVLIGSQGCSVLEGDSNAKEERVCTPGAYVFCRCADRSEGTKLCKDGKSFEPCTTDGAGECAGGEIEDPDTGQEVDQEGNIIEQDDAGTGGGGTTPSIDACPGKSTSLTPGQELVLEGDTTGAKDDAKGKTGACAAGAGGPDHVYRLIPTGTGSLNIKVQGTAPLNPTIYLRSTCADEAAQLACGEQTAAGGIEQLNVNVVNGREYFLFVDGASSSAGKYKITAKLTSGSFCGDNSVGANEACDDGNKVEDDGCSNDCQKPNGNPTSGGSCPGHPVHIWPGRTVTASGSNATYGNAMDKPSTACSVSGTSNAHSDHVYEVTPHASGTLRVVLTPASTVNLMLFARRSCSDPTSTVTSPASSSMCKNDGVSGGTETMTFSVTKDTKVYVVVDGGGTAANSKGSYTISFSIQ